MESKNALFVFILFLVTLVIVVLLPISFGYLEYYEYGLKQNRATGKVDTSKVYDGGRYLIGPNKKFLKYQADAHFVDIKELSVFSSSGGGSDDQAIGLEFKLDIFFSFFLKEDKVGSLHEDLAKQYKNIIISRAESSIKNEAATITFAQYFELRIEVEKIFAAAVQEGWDRDPPLYCELDQFYLSRIKIPESVATKQLEAKVQNERNNKEDFLQQAAIQREQTAVQVNAVFLEEDKVLRTAKAEASLIRSKARTRAREIEAEAQVNGTKYVFETSNITEQEHKIAFMYIRAILERGDVSVDVSSYTENILKTKIVSP